MKSRRLRPALFAALVPILLIPASGAAEDVKERGETVTASGFLGDYSQLKRGREGGAFLLYLKEEGILKSYRDFIIDPVLVFLHPEAYGRGVDPAELKQLTDDFRAALVAELESTGTYRVVGKPGPGVARFRAAITDVKPAGMGLNQNAAVIDPALPGTGLGAAEVEVEILDSVSEERLAAAMDRRRGTRFKDLEGGGGRWDDVEAIFRQWARQFREALDRMQSEG